MKNCTFYECGKCKEPYFGGTEESHLDADHKVSNFDQCCSLCRSQGHSKDDKSGNCLQHKLKQGMTMVSNIEIDREMQALRGTLKDEVKLKKEQLFLFSHLLGALLYLTSLYCFGQ